MSVSYDHGRVAGAAQTSSLAKQSPMRICALGLCEQ